MKDEIKELNNVITNISSKDFFLSVIREINNYLRNFRDETMDFTNRSENAVGITSLLSCPIKYSLKRKYKDSYKELEEESLEIYDGYLWEYQVKKALRNMFGNKFKEEVDLIYKDELLNFTIHGYLDCMIDMDDYIIAIELKSPKFLLSKDFKISDKISENMLIIDDENKILHNKKYIEQAKLEKFILQKMYNKKVYHYIFYKTLLLINENEIRKSFIVYELTEDIDEVYVQNLIKKFLTSNKPSNSSECNYCVFGKNGLCEYYNKYNNDLKMNNNNLIIEEIINNEKEIDFSEIDFWNLYFKYKNIERYLKIIYNFLIENVDKSFYCQLKNGEEIGWKEIKRYDIDLIKLIDRIIRKNDDLNKYIQLKDDVDIYKLIEDFGHDIIKGGEIFRKFII